MIAGVLASGDRFSPIDYHSSMMIQQNFFRIPDARLRISVSK